MLYNKGPQYRQLGQKYKEVKYMTFSKGRPAEDIMLFPATKGYITYCIIFKIYMYVCIGI